jgi:hypothetical protein
MEIRARSQIVNRGVDDPAVLRPRLLYEQQGRSSEDAEVVARLHTRRTAHLGTCPDLRPEIVDTV